MRKNLKINAKYLPINLGITHIAAYMYFWERFNAEWFRTLLAVFIVLHLLLMIIDAYTNDRTKDLVFKD